QRLRYPWPPIPVARRPSHPSLHRLAPPPRRPRTPTTQERSTMRLRFLPNTATWSTALVLACALPSCSSDSKSDTARATETDDNSSSDDDSPSDTPEAGTSEGDDDGAAES